MKKYILSALLALIYLLPSTLHPPRTVANAQADADAYACILDADTYFYTTQDETRGLFLLPKTYFVKIVEYGEYFCLVEYLSDSQTTKKLSGYVKTDKLTFVDFVPYMPYLYHSLEVRYVIDGSPQDSSFLSSVTLRFAYYGDYVVGTKTYCYVLRENTFGYVPKPENFHFAENTEYAEYLASLQPPDGNSSTTAQPPPTQTAGIITLCLLVPTLTAFILRPNKRTSYDQDEFEYVSGTP